MNWFQVQGFGVFIFNFPPRHCEERSSQIFIKLSTMSPAINLNPVISVRKEPAETSELITQLLFGEVFTCTQVLEKWCQIKNFADGYEGWIDRKMATFISEQEFETISTRPAHLVFSPFAKIKNIASANPFFLTCGSVIPNYDEKENAFSIGGTYFFLLEGEVALPRKGNSTLLQVARSFLHVPYLWGGKNFFGIDCSGFVQVVMSLFGHQLPRDSKDQALLGYDIPFEDRQPNDLAFFQNEKGNVVHVGIITESRGIIHASGRVRMDTLTETGIFSEEDNRQTHLRCKIKRLFFS